MHKGRIYFNGKCSHDLGIVVEEVPSLSRPQRKYDEYVVPGRSGTIITQYDAYENIEKNYNIWFTDYHYKDLYSPVKAREIAAWLYSSNGYMTLEDDFEPEYYRLAYFNGPLDIANIMQKYGKCTISFTCRPERYLKSGDNWITNPTSVKNPYVFDAKPLIQISTTGNANITIGDSTFAVTGINGTVFIDSETMNVYDVGGNSMNANFAGDFPILKHGENVIIINTPMASPNTIRVQPRLWTL